MTITYSLDVANTRFCGFAKLLGRWKGSIYKILWKEFLVFVIGYTLISITYRFFLDSDQKRMFESVVIYFESFLDLIPLSFVLGFYVSLVIGRWWEQYDAIPWPDRLCYLIAAYVHGSDERSRIIRRTLGRYLILMQAFTYQAVSTAFKKRFPTTKHFVAAGFMTKEERTVFENLDAKYGKWWMPAQWFSALAMRAKKEGRIKDSVLLNGLMVEFMRYRSACGTMFNYDWISVPLVYTQVVTLATYTYSLALIIGRQYLDPSQGHANHKVDLYIPVFTLLQFFFYVGWLKVAEQIVNPYGEDDDDFELNWCLDRSVHVIYMVVDHFHARHPKLRKDAFWDILLPEMPQTKNTVKNIVSNPQLGSAFNYEVDPADSEYLPVETLLEEDNEANIYHSYSAKHTSGIRHRPSFLMSIFGSSFGQGARKMSVQKNDSFKELQSHANPAFVANPEKAPSRRSSSPANSRKSSVAKRSSPSHSRASSISFHPGSISRLRHKSYDLPQHPEGNFSILDGDAVAPVGMAVSMAPAESDFEEDPNTNSLPISNTGLESDSSHQKMDSHMPPIPEEPTSRVVSMANLDLEDQTNKLQCTSKPLDNVQSLVAEASKVLEELNKAVSSGRHRQDCVTKGYESCCSLDSEDSTEDEDDAVQNASDVNKSSDSVLVDVSRSFEDAYRKHPNDLKD